MYAVVEFVVAMILSDLTNDYISIWKENDFVVLDILSKQCSTGLKRVTCLNSSDVF